MAEQPTRLGWVNRFDTQFEAAGGTEYVRRLVEIENAAPGSPLAKDWAAWKDMVIGSTFDGVGDHVGLTAMSQHLVDCFCTFVHEQNEQLIKRWLARICLVLQKLADMGVPPLNPLLELQTGLGYAVRAMRGADAHNRIPHVDLIRDKWVANRESVINKLMNALAALESKPILVVGHSGIVLEAYRRLMAERNLALDLTFCCPNPDRSSSDPLAEGNRPQGASPYDHRVRGIKCEVAEGLIKERTFERVFCSACAYTEDKKNAWVTHGARELAMAAAQSKVVFQPIGGEYKQITMEWDINSQCHVADCISHFDSGLLI